MLFISAIYPIWSLVLISFAFKFGTPIIMTALANSSVKSIPSANFPLEIAKNKAPFSVSAYF